MNKILIYFAISLMLAGSVFAGDYVIGDGDTLQVSVWGSPELSITTSVRPDGMISIPAVGEIRATGSTPLELTEAIKTEMEKLVKAPIVTVIVNNVTNYCIYVFGKGVTPGVITLKRETTLLELLSQLGQLSNSDLEKSYLVRNKEKIKTDFTGLFEKGDFSQDITLKPGDMLFIPDNFDKRVSIVGEVIKPATIPYRTGLRILDLIVAAEGLTKFANESNVEIIRTNGSDKMINISVNMRDLKKGSMENNVIIMPGDYVVVKDALF